jgi:hypothetical protein
LANAASVQEELAAAMQQAIDPVTRTAAAGALYVVAGGQQQVIQLMTSVVAAHDEPLILRKACLGHLADAAGGHPLPDAVFQKIRDLVFELAQRDPSQTLRVASLEAIGEIGTIDDLTRLQHLLIAPNFNQEALDALWSIFHRHPDEAGRGAALLAEFLAVEYSKSQASLTVPAVDVFSTIAITKNDPESQTALNNIANSLSELAGSHSRMEVRRYCQLAADRLRIVINEHAEESAARPAPP